MKNLLAALFLCATLSSPSYALDGRVIKTSACEELAQALEDSAAQIESASRSIDDFDISNTAHALLPQNRYQISEMRTAGFQAAIKLREYAQNQYALAHAYRSDCQIR